MPAGQTYSIVIVWFYKLLIDYQKVPTKQQTFFTSVTNPTLQPVVVVVLPLVSIFPIFVQNVT
jgi:hypothetical protein